MNVNIYEDELQNVWLFGQTVLYTEQPIPREEVPKGWHCYDLKGTAENPKRPPASREGIPGRRGA